MRLRSEGGAEDVSGDQASDDGPDDGPDVGRTALIVALDRRELRYALLMVAVAITAGFSVA